MTRVLYIIIMYSTLVSCPLSIIDTLIAKKLSTVSNCLQVASILPQKLLVGPVKSTCILKLKFTDGYNFPIIRGFIMFSARRATGCCRWKKPFALKFFVRKSSFPSNQAGKSSGSQPVNLTADHPLMKPQYNALLISVHYIK